MKLCEGLLSSAYSFCSFRCVWNRPGLYPGGYPVCTKSPRLWQIGCVNFRSGNTFDCPADCSSPRCHGSRHKLDTGKPSHRTRIPIVVLLRSWSQQLSIDSTKLAYGGRSYLFVLLQASCARVYSDALG